MTKEDIEDIQEMGVYLEKLTKDPKKIKELQDNIRMFYGRETSAIDKRFTI